MSLNLIHFKFFFANFRAAMKMANMDAVLDFMFTNPKDANGVIPTFICFICFYFLLSRHVFTIFHCRLKVIYLYTVEPLLRGHPDERPLPLERPLDKENLNINVLISTPDERPPLLKGHFSDAKGVASQEGFHCNAPVTH